MIVTTDIGNILYRDCRAFGIGIAEVNLCVPDLSENEANTIRLNELERKAGKLFDDVVSTYDGTTYRYSIESISIEADTALKCHYVNVRILFEVLNVKL